MHESEQVCPHVFGIESDRHVLRTLCGIRAYNFDNVQSYIIAANAPVFSTSTILSHTKGYNFLNACHVLMRESL